MRGCFSSPFENYNKDRRNIKHGKENLENTQKTDLIKKNWAKENNYNFLEVLYSQKIEEIKEKLCHILNL
jgi:hypothetical protein